MRIEIEPARTHRLETDQDDPAPWNGVEPAGDGARSDEELARLRTEWGAEPGHR